MLHEEIMKYVPEELKKAVKKTDIDEYGYWIWFTDDYVVNTSGQDLQFYYMHDLTAHHVSYCFEHVRKVSESSEQEREEEEEEEEEEEPEELDQPTDVDQTDDPQLDMNQCGYVIYFEVSLYLPCKSTKEYTDKFIELNTRDLSWLYSAFYDAAILAGSTLGYDLTKSSIDISHSISLKSLR